MQDEINIRVFVQPIIDNIKQLTIIVASITALTLLFNLLLLKPEYQASALVTINNSIESEQKPLDLNTYKEQIRTDSEIQKIILRLQLDSEEYTTDYLKKQIIVEPIKNTNSVQIILTDKNKFASSKLVDAFAVEMGVLVEVFSGLEAITTHEKKILELEDSLSSLRGQLDQAKKELVNIPEKVQIIKSLVEDPLLLNLQKEKQNKDTKNIASQQFISEEINPVHQKVATTISDLSISINQNNSEIEQHKKRIDDLNKSIQDIQSIVDENKTPVFTSGSRSILITKSIIPTDPVAPKKVINTVLAFLLSTILSVAYILIKEYWRKSSVQTHTSI